MTAKSYFSWKATPFFCNALVTQGYFLDYLKASGVYFLMCHDGASIAVSPHNPSIQTAPDAKPSEKDLLETRRRVIFRVMIYALIGQGYNVALINGLEWADTKVRVEIFTLLLAIC